MIKNPLYPDPPHISIAFYLDEPEPARVLYAVCAEVTGAGAAGTGVCEHVRSDTFPVFDAMSDLGDRIERSTCDLSSPAGRRKWQRLIAGADSTTHVLKAGFEVARVGAAVVTLQPSGAARRHPVAVDVSGALLDLAASPFLSKRERTNAQAAADWIDSLFRRTCDSLDPLYASILAEAWLPTPPTLVAAGARLGTEVYLSDRLEAATPKTQSAVARLYARCRTERAKTGQLYWWSAGLAPPKKGAPEPLALGRDTAAIVGRALAGGRKGRTA